MRTEEIHAHYRAYTNTMKKENVELVIFVHTIVLYVYQSNYRRLDGRNILKIELGV